MEATQTARKMERVEAVCGTCEKPYEFDVPASDPNAPRRAQRIREALRDLAMKREECQSCAALKRLAWNEEDAMDARRRLEGIRQSRLTSSGLDPFLVRKSMALRPAQHVLEAAQAWASTAGRLGASVPPGLLLYGNKGTGKTSVAVLAFYEMLARRPGYWRPAVQLVRDAFSPFESPEREAAQELAAGRHVMVLDDLDKTRTTETATSELFSIVDALYSRGTPFIVTMNSTPAEFARMHGSDGEKIVSRLREACQGIKFDGPDLRVGRPMIAA